MYPRRCTNDLVAQDDGREIVIYDDARQHFHTLNATAASVWRLADGATSCDEMALRLDIPRDVIDLTIGQLADVHLIEGVFGQTIDRRAVVKKLALAGIAGAVVLPVISSATAAARPPVSCLPSGAPCTVGLCCSPYTCFAGTCQLPPP